jgi:SagB-type dehydrogenase family enzyme
MMIDHGNDARSGGTELWSFREDVQVELAPGEGSVRLVSHWGEATVERPSAEVREVLRRMQLGPVSLGNVIGARARRPGSAAEDEEAETEEFQQWVRLYAVLDRLQPLVIRTLSLEAGQPLLSVVPMTPQSRFRPMPFPDDTLVRLSVYAEMRTDGREFRIESPLALHRVVVHRPEAMRLIGALGTPVTAAALVRAWPELEPFAVGALTYLAAAGMVVAADSGTGQVPPVFTEDAELAGWSPVDLMFHVRSTAGRHDQPLGASYPLGRAGSPEPVVLSRRAGPGIALHRPRWEDLSAADPPLTVAMEGRRSVRRHGVEPVTASELGDLLYRTARVRALITPPDADGGTFSAGQPDPRLSDRPYPSGGACYEIELYVTVGDCQGIAPGIYHYDPVGHQLELVNASRETAGGLLTATGRLAAMDRPPPLLITMTARFRRVSWKYQGIAYATVLKDVGALTQSLYLVCTAMGLAPCAVGLVHADATAQAFDIDWRHEPSVGQFIIGRAPEALPEYAWQWHPVNDDAWPDEARRYLRAAPGTHTEPP